MFGALPWRTRAAILLLVVLLVSCTETDDALFDQIGVTRILLIDPAQAAQSLFADEPAVQVAEWELEAANLEYAGSVFDLLIGENCSIVDTAPTTPVLDGRCSGGVVVPSSSQPAPISLTLGVVSMHVRRARPPDLSGPDFDGDGVPTDGDGSGSPFDNPCGLGGTTIACDDNCPLVPNPDQADANSDGVGNACQTVDAFTGPSVLDSDADGVVDALDNCVWVFNPGQEDTGGVSATGPSDGIGDACEEQVARVLLDGAESFELQLGPSELTLALGGGAFVTVDFGNGDPLDCDWELGECALDPDAVRVCGLAPSLAFVLGCPDGR